jgi:hypothetical protein
MPSQSTQVPFPKNKARLDAHIPWKFDVSPAYRREAPRENPEIALCRARKSAGLAPERRIRNTGARDGLALVPELK